MATFEQASGVGKIQKKIQKNFSKVSNTFKV